MWAIRILTGPQAGQSIKLNQGRNLVGRAAQCHIKLNSAGVSKEHAEINVFPDRVVVTDLQSSNGTFINGVKVQSRVVRLGDKIGIHDILLDIAAAPVNKAPVIKSNVQVSPTMAPPPGYNLSGPQGAMPGAMGTASAQPPAYTPPQPPLQALLSKLQEYMDRVALPAIYQLAKVFEFKMVVLGFIGVFIFVTTLLSMIPMLTITREAVVLESQRRAQGLARSLADLNQIAFLKQEMNALAVDSVQIQEGVEQAMIVEQASGNIVAPASRAGGTADIPFISKIRSEGRGFVGKTGNIIVASFPIGAFDSSTGEQSIRAHAIVVYDMSALEIDEGRALSLFLQTLVIASIVGLLLFYLLYSLIEYPIKTLNTELDGALREKRDTTKVDIFFPPLQALVGNINSLLTRYIHGSGESSAGGGFVNRDGEMENLIQMMGLPGIVINNEDRIVALNNGFAQIARTEIHALQGQPVQSIPDNALQLNLKDLKRRCSENMRQIQTDQLEFSGHPCQMSCQVLTQNGSEPEFFVVTIAPIEGE